jgi:hypothetical protein
LKTICNAALVFAVANVNAILFVAGIVALYAGVAGISQPWANVVLGVVLMALGAYPYVRKV